MTLESVPVAPLAECFGEPLTFRQGILETPVKVSHNAGIAGADMDTTHQERNLCFWSLHGSPGTKLKVVKALTPHLEAQPIGPTVNDRRTDTTNRSNLRLAHNDQI
jgi:hypothetical protein